MALVEFGIEQISHLDFETPTAHNHGADNKTMSNNYGVVVPLDFSPSPQYLSRGEKLLATENKELVGNIGAAATGSMIDKIKAFPDVVELGIRRIIGKVAAS